MSTCRAIARLGGAKAEEVDTALISDLLDKKGALVWLDVHKPDETDIALLREEFGFHELSLEDALRRKQRPKVDEYENYYFIVLYAASSGTNGTIVPLEVHFFWGPNYIVTLHEETVPEIDDAIARWASGQAQPQWGVAHQVYTLLDSVIDGYFPAVDALAERIDDIEHAMFQHQANPIEEIFFLRKQLLDARRLLGPSRDVLNVLIRRDVAIFPLELIPYLADVYDHAIRVIDTLDLHRDLLGTAVDSYLSLTSNRLNQTMRTLTALTIGIMVPTLIAGIYGMNFDNMPEVKWALGYPMALGMMVVAVVVLFFVFRRVGWLGSTDSETSSSLRRRSTSEPKDGSD